MRRTAAMAKPAAVAAAVFDRISGQKRSDQLVSDADFDASRSVSWFSSTAPIAIFCFREVSAEIWVGFCFPVRWADTGMQQLRQVWHSLCRP